MLLLFYSIRIKRLNSHTQIQKTTLNYCDDAFFKDGQSFDSTEEVVDCGQGHQKFIQEENLVSVVQQEDHKTQRLIFIRRAEDHDELVLGMTEEKELGGIEEQLVGKKIKEEMSYTRINVGRTRKMVKLKRCLPYGDTNHDILLKK